MNPRFKYLIQLFRKLPGVGPRQAARFVLSLLDRTDQELHEIGTAITSLHKSIRFCSSCANIAENHVCAICADKRRDTSKVLVVEKVTDLDSVEKTGLYQGTYHVLGGVLNPVEGTMPEHLHISELMHRIKGLTAKHENVEIILATNPTTPGETTSLYLQELLKNEHGVTVTRLARGLASGSHLEYADEMTIKHALQERR